MQISWTNRCMQPQVISANASAQPR